MEAQQWNVSYTYNQPHGAGPFRGRMVVSSATKPIKGDGIYAAFGAATIKTVSKVKPKV
jgi:hypothetical protein